MGDDLSAYTSDELQAELKRRKVAHKPQPAFRCERCGAVGYYLGHFKPHWFEVQHKAFIEKHARCLPTADGGCI